MTCSLIGSLPHCLTQPMLGSIVHAHRLPPPYLWLLAIISQGRTNPTTSLIGFED